MSKIIIKCISCDSIYMYKYNIKIYNYMKELIYDNEILNKTCVDLNNNELYFIVIKPPLGFYPNKICRPIYINNSFDEISFMFNSIERQFIFVDDKYDGLPIEKGEIDLWRNHTR